MKYAAYEAASKPLKYPEQYHPVSTVVNLIQSSEKTKARDCESGLLSDYVWRPLLVGRVDGDLLPVLAHPLELHDTIDEREESVIPAAAYIVAGMDVGAVLTVENVPCFDRLAAEFLAAKPLAG